jgi:hypothetical protein
MESRQTQQSSTRLDLFSTILVVHVAAIHNWTRQHHQVIVRVCDNGHSHDLPDYYIFGLKNKDVLWSLELKWTNLFKLM